MFEKRMSTHGAVNIPVQMRREMGLQPKDVLTVEEKDGTIMISPRQPRCVFCGSDECVHMMRGRGICRGCAEKAIAILERGGCIDE